MTKEDALTIVTSPALWHAATNDADLNTARVALLIRACACLGADVGRKGRVQIEADPANPIYRAATDA